MNDSSLKAALGTQTKRLQLVSTSVDEEEFQSVNFGRVGTRPQLMVMFQTADGFCEGFEYAHINGFTTPDPDTSIRIQFVGRTVLIEGINLKKLLRMLMEHRLSEVVDTGRTSALVGDEQTPIVTRLEIRNSAPTLRKS